MGFSCLCALALAAVPVRPAVDSRPAVGSARVLHDGPRAFRAVLVEDSAPLQRWQLSWEDGRTAPAWAGRAAIVRLDDDADPARAWDALGVRPGRVLMPSARLWLVEDVDPAVSGVELAARLHGRPGVAGEFPDFSFRTETRMTIPPTDPRFSGQWYLDRINIREAWALSTGSPDTTVVVIDNGCDMTHPDLAANMDPGRDVVDGDDDPSYEPGANGNNHGTSCAGIVAAVTDNALGIAGACPSCRLRCVRLLSDSGMTPVSADVEAFQFVIDSGAAVASNSWGFVDAFPVPTPLATAMERAFDTGRGGKGAVIVFASGNEDRQVTSDELLGVRGVIGVGATTNFDETTSFSNYGEPVDLVAPTGTLTTDIQGAAGEDPGDYTQNFGGTSSACPVAAGVAGLVVSAAPDKTAAELTEILVHATRPAPYASPDDAGHDPHYGWGVLDAPTALRRAMGLPDPVDGGSGSSSSSSSGGSGGDAPPLRPGCGCGAAGAAGPGALGLLLALFVARRRR